MKYINIIAFFILVNFYALSTDGLCEPENETECINENVNIEFSNVVEDFACGLGNFTLGDPNQVSVKTTTIVFSWSIPKMQVPDIRYKSVLAQVLGAMERDAQKNHQELALVQ